MNYRHQYHAGNFADVLKHTVLITLLEALSKKDKAWCYMETHAGRGLYDLSSNEAQKTKEFENGIGKIFPTIDFLPQYHHILTKTGYPRYYPGSPLIAYHYLRPQDNMILIEKHPEEVQALKACFRPLNNAQIAIHQQEGYQAMKAFLPPKTGRGLILIDPPFEQENEWQNISASIRLRLSRFAQGIYTIWYPIKTLTAPKFKTEVSCFHSALRHLANEYHLERILIVELCIYSENHVQGLNGAGLAIINPPWQIEARLNELCKQLFEILSPYSQGRFLVKLL